MSELSPFAATVLDELEPAVRECIDEVLPGDAADQTVSVWLGDLDGGVHVAVDADVPHYAASTMKLPLLVAAYRRHRDGTLDLDREVPVHNEFASATGGSPFALAQEDDQDDWTWERIGSTVPLRELARHAVVKSGNLATNLLLEQVGPGAVAEVLDLAGCSPATLLPRGIGDLAAHDAGLDNLVTAEDLALVMRGIAARSLAEPETCRRVEEVLAGQEHRAAIPAGLPAGTYAANKTGWVDGICHDVALVRPDRRPGYVLVVLCTLDVPEEAGTALIREISEVVWEGWHR